MKIEGGRFLIVGGASLSGSHIADKLLAAGAAEVRLFDNFALGSPDTIAHLADDPRIQVVAGDMLRLADLIEAADGIDGIFLVAAYLAGPIAARPAVGVEVNTTGVLNVLEAARARNVSRIVYSSSVGVYGNAVDIDNVDENLPLITAGLGSVMTVYSASKLLAEGLFRMYHEKYGQQFAALRYSSIYGPRQHTRSINALPIVEIYNRIIASERPVIFGDGNDVHDYLYVEDLADANVLAMQSDVPASAMNITSGQARSINDIAHTLLEITGSDLEIEYRQPEGLRFTTSTKLNYDIRHAREVIGWTPAHTLEDGLRSYVQWRRERAEAESVTS